MVDSIVQIANRPLDSIAKLLGNVGVEILELLLMNKIYSINLKFYWFKGVYSTGTITLLFIKCYLTCSGNQISCLELLLVCIFQVNLW